MAFNNNQEDSALPVGASTKRTTLDLIPKYFRTDTNQKFLNATADQMISEGSVEKINAFIGRRDTTAFNPADRYLEEVSPERQAYQLEPALVSYDNLDNVTFFKDYNDYIGQLGFFSNTEVDHNIANSNEFYTWNPHIDWDKFVNYREYYWLPNGPQPVTVLGQSTAIVSTYSVVVRDQIDNVGYIFSPKDTGNGLIVNPSLKLYRGQTYRFEVDAASRPIALKTSRALGDDNFFTEGVKLYNSAGVQIVDENKDPIANQYVSNGVIEITIPTDAPNTIFYVSESDINASGFFKVYDISESTEIDVDVEIVGKKSYTTSSGVTLSNGMKLNFQGNVTPEKYSLGNWYVEGVGSEIRLISEKDLETPAPYTIDAEIEFDNEHFDSQGFDVNNNFPKEKDYITINRASTDRNIWSRYNRWFHREVIEASAYANSQPVVLDQSSRATRPIIEFSPNLQLWNFGRVAKNNVTLVDDYTVDVFSTIEGSVGYNIDGVSLVDGMRVLFTADTDSRVNGRIYKVTSFTHLGVNRITLVPTDDSDPIEGETILVTAGVSNRGKMFYYNGTSWVKGQEKTHLNQAPMFDVFDANGVSFGDKTQYPGTTFNGTKLFSYREGNVYDPELKFNLSYRNVGNFGDIVFDFNLHTDQFVYQQNIQEISVKIDTGHLKVNHSLTSFEHVNGWSIAASVSNQPVVREFLASDGAQEFFPIDVYEDSGRLTDLNVKVWVNGNRYFSSDFAIEIDSDVAYVQLLKPAELGDIVTIKTTSSAPKTDKGYYQFPINLENNPQNLSLDHFTLGEINAHVSSIVSNIPRFEDVIPGRTSLRDLGNITPLGTKIVQHSASLVPVAYHLTSKEYNVIKAIRSAKRDYAKFKRNLVRIATSLAFDGQVRHHLDAVLREVTKDQSKVSPYYLSDMLPYGTNFVFDQEVIDDSITEYPLSFDFNLNELSNRAVLVYLNGVQLLHKKEYEFTSDNFVKILAKIQSGDNLKIVQYESTDGCFVPPTPSKLGLYPLYEPKIYVDTTYQEPTTVIQGHDGSIVVAFGDFRDDLILEFEKRIFNNVKVQYDRSLLDIYDFINGYNRKSLISTDALNSVLAEDFLSWTRLISGDYTKHEFYDQVNPFTYNYREFSSATGSKLPNYWRGIYKEIYDTDRPHMCPWEMLGFSIEPSWWAEVYGTAPYTSNNLILWEDLSQGLVKEPNTPVKKLDKFVRPNLLNWIPVDEQGNLRSPLEIGIVHSGSVITALGSFVFGDCAPVENAWRRSSEYPYALLTALTSLVPARVFATCFDRSRQFRDETGQILYKTDSGNLRFSVDKLLIPSTPASTSRVMTAGLVNFIVDYIVLTQSVNDVNTYINELTNLQVRLSSKLGGFTSKEKFKLVLDSRSPLSTGSVFVPEENYKIILNTSSPQYSLNYSGVIIEKQPSGFVIKGYNNQVPVFKYFKPLPVESNIVVNVGGISETYVSWTAYNYYSKGQVVQHSGSYYRTSVSHTSTGVFEEKYFVRLHTLPLVGGRNIVMRTRFEEDASTLHYGAELETVQDVVDFLLGYEKYLISVGFNFDHYNPTLKHVTNFQTSAKEFAFWTTQNWSAGSVISLSPSAEAVSFKKDYYVVDNILDNFYEYSVFKQDGNILEPSFTNNVRAGNGFSISPRNTADGIYHATLNLVQKEHVLILDNVTIFNDVLYDQLQGYRQARIKVVGYRTSNWQGDFNIPGFVYDSAKTTMWEPWTDYNLGATVKYKEFYYSAKFNVAGSQEFNFDEWDLLESRPEEKLIPNWDYRANQFADFYDLDTDSFDTTQQKFAQHLIGYQKRQYLQNIINDDVSQYKFYQGMIQEKGTQNSLSKLFDALSTADKESVEFYEEWAIRLGQYGANAGFEEVEYLLDEGKFLINPQPIELVNRVDPNIVDFVYRIPQNQVYIKPVNYNHAPLPTRHAGKTYVATAGYVRVEDVEYSLDTLDDITSVNINTLKTGDHFWIGSEKNAWNVYRLSSLANSVKDVTEDGGYVRFTLTRSVSSDINVGNFIGVNSPDSSNVAATQLEGFHKVTKVGYNYIEIATPEVFDLELLTEINFNLFKLVSVRLKSIDQINSLAISDRKSTDTVWIDGENNNWEVWQYDDKYAVDTVSNSLENFGKSLTVDATNTTLVIGSKNQVSYYVRPTTKFPWAYRDQLTVLSTQHSASPNFKLTVTNNTFGEVVTLDKTGEFLLVGAPGASTLTGDNSSKNTGYVAVYRKNDNGYFTFVTAIISDSATPGERFGQHVKFLNNRILVASRGSETSAPYIAAYSLTGTLISKMSFSLGTTILDVCTSQTDRIAVSLSTCEVNLIDFNDAFAVIATYTAPQTGQYSVGKTTEYGYSIALNTEGTRLLVGVPDSSIRSPLSGAVLVYYLDNNKMELITNPVNMEGEKFGSLVRFSDNSEQIIVRAAGGTQESMTTFDGASTTFDLEATVFKEKEVGVGSIAVFNFFATQYIFSNYLNIGDALGVEFGEALTVTDRVYAGDYTPTQGAVYEFNLDSIGWVKTRSPSPVVDIDKIKSVFLYDTETNEMVTYLDVVDPIQGKILGIAEQEIRFKTYYDPATYSVGVDEVVVDELSPWKDKQVGMLWWDLGSAKFINPAQGSILFKANTWNTTYLDETVSVYEWVESEYLPSEWDELADTEEGLTLGISGQSKYGDNCYSVSRAYDNVAKTFRNVYYFWVKNTTVVPSNGDRKLSAKDVARYITNPKDMGISYITLLDSNQFALVNCKNLISGKKIALNIRYWVIDNTEHANIHSHYQLVSAGDASKPINKYIEQKWFDSLTGFDFFGNEVPDMSLPVKLRYGILNKPRQSMFVNRLEALKQYIERVNSVLVKKPLIDNYDFTLLNSKDTPPSYGSGQYDIEISNYSEIRFVGTNEVSTAKLTPVIENGKIIRVNIDDAGLGYLNPPNVIVHGIGSGAVVKTTIGDKGQLTSATVEQTGNGYLQSTTVTVRPLTVLVTSDETANGKWVLYSWNAENNSWFKEHTQTFDTTRYWKYIDWFATGYNEFTKVDHILDFVYQLPYANVQMGEVVKIKNQGAGGWILLEKINNQEILDTTVNYKTIGRQNGTIQFTDNLYRFAINGVGYDGPIYDNSLFDDQPKTELRIILECVRDTLLVNDLDFEYKELFFASLRYVFSEQKSVDWAFKTSFVRAKHNLGKLDAKPTYQNDNLDSYVDYINEVKPYRSKVREFVSTYNSTDVAHSNVTDFDLPVHYDEATGQLVPFSTSVVDGIVVYDSEDMLQTPYADWFYNAGNQLVEIKVVDSGSGYVSAPIVEIQDAPPTLTATAYISAGKLTKISFNDPDGVLFLSTPTVYLNGSVSEGGHHGRAVAILGNGLVRSTKVGIKFDRISPEFTLTDINTSEEFIGNGKQTRFVLNWPIDLVTTRTVVTDNKGEVLSTDYSVFNEIDSKYDYTRYNGVLQFKSAPETASKIVIQYYKNIDLLDAADRINHFYNPQPGQLGKDLGQLMQGVDYGGVEVTGIDFNVGAGWDAHPWFTSGYDIFDPEFTDMLVRSDGVNRSLMLNYIPTDIEVINIYVNGNRIDDLYYDAVYPLTTDLAAQRDTLATLTSDLTAAEVNYNDSLVLIDQLGNSTTGLIVLKESEIERNNLEIIAKEAELNTAQTENPDDLATIDRLEKELADLVLISTRLSSDLAELNSQLTAAIESRDAISEVLLEKRAAVATQQSVVDAIQNQLDALPEITNSSAVMNSFVGNGVDAGPIVIPDSYPLADGDMIVLRKSTSDGSFKPSDMEYDSQIHGGDFTYASASGIKPEDINIDGDGFVTPYTSHAPEEVVTGQVVDTVDISVYHKVSDGAPIIETQLYYASGEPTFALSQKPNTDNAVLVKIAGRIAIQDTDYTVDYENQEVVLTNPVDDGTEIVIISMGQNGTSILDMDYFVGDGVTKEFITAARWTGEYTTFVTVNGKAADISTFITNNSYELVGNIGIQFEIAPSADSIICYTVLGSAVDSISKVQKETIIYDGVSSVYTMANNPEFVKPLADNVLVLANGKILKPADTVYFTVSGTSRTFTVNPSVYEFNTVDNNQISVLVNGVPITQTEDYQWYPVNNQLKIKRGVASSGDLITVVINVDADYAVEEVGTKTELRLFKELNAGDIIRIMSFSNHDILDIRRSTEYVKTTSVLIQDNVDSYKVAQITGGRIKLARPAIDAEYVWVTLNRTLLTPNVDYVLENNLNYIRLKSTITLVEPDVIEVILFSNKTTRNAFGYKIFKDVLNKNTYLRIDDSASTVLAEPLYYYDAFMTVVDATKLPTPSAALNIPGVVLINGERIEYYTKTGNVLGQLRRGTLGTGVKSLHKDGDIVRDQSRLQSVPYKDDIVVSTITTSGFTHARSIYVDSPEIQVASVIIPTDDNTCSAGGGDLITVTGSGFESNVRVFVGDTECETTRIDSSRLTFMSPDKALGVYDLVILNAAIEQSLQRQTSKVVPMAMKYLKVALDFIPMEPIVNAGIAVSGPDTWLTDGYNTQVPAGYIQADDIEVFVGGVRLHKAPYTVWNAELGQDSPSGDKRYDAEFAVTGKDNFVRLTEVPPPGVTIVVQKRVGKTWTTNGVGLADSLSDQAKFIKSAYTVLPK